MKNHIPVGSISLTEAFQIYHECLWKDAPRLEPLPKGDLEGGKHPCDRARPGIGIVRQQARMALGDMEHDRSCLEQGEIAFLIGRNLAERMKRPMRIHQRQAAKGAVG